jgi:hypothetical protein
MTDEASLLLSKAAARAAHRPEFIAFALKFYCEHHQRNLSTLAEEVTATPETLVRIGLCLRPREESFEQDLRELRDKFVFDHVALARVLRFVDVISAFSEKNENAAATTGIRRASDDGFLLAARTRSQMKNHTDGSGNGKGDE